MEKVKWAVLIVLFISLIVVIIRNSEKKTVELQPDNYAKVEIMKVVPQEYQGKGVFIENGTYMLELDYIQKVSGKADGWFMHFTKKNQKEDMILTIELSDTTNLFLNPKFPLFFHTLQHDVLIPPFHFYRTKMDIGYAKNITPHITDEMSIKMKYFVGKIHSLEVNDEKVQMQMEATATHDDFLIEIFNAKYVMKVTVHIQNAQVLERVI